MPTVPLLTVAGWSACPLRSVNDSRGDPARCRFRGPSSGCRGREAVPEPEPLPPVRLPQRRVGGGQGALPALPRADDDLLGQHGDPPRLRSLMPPQGGPPCSDVQNR